MFGSLVLSLVLVSVGVRGQDTCDADGDCAGDDNCCSSFGFCGMGEGFCTPSSRSRPVLGRQRDEEPDSRGTSNRGSSGSRSGVRRSGAGCVLEDTELVGGDIPAILGGGGISLDRDTADECFRRCDDNPACRWYTWDNRENLCYLKSGRGFLRNRTDDFTSGATFRDGCNRDPYCVSPYSTYRYQCLFFSQQGGLGQEWLPSLADARRNLNHSRELCEELGGFVPYSYDGYGDYQSAGLGPGGSRLGDAWTWTGFPSEGGNCFACRPGRIGEGVQAFPCSENLAFGCQARGAFPFPAPKRPHLYTAPVVAARTRPVAAGCIGCRRRRLRGRGLRRRLAPRRRLAFGSLSHNPYLG